MVILALIAAAAAAQPAPERAGVVVQASATVRIVAGRRLTLGAATAEAELRRTQVRDSAGLVRPAQLIEFQ